MKKLFVIASMVAGCAGAPPAPPQIVKVPVAVSCVSQMPIAPVFEFDALTPAASDGDKVLALARDWPRGRAYEGLLEAAIAGCQ